MRTRSVLVYLPGYPFTIDTLRPNRELGTLAAFLADQGHECRILDYGTLEAFKALHPPELRPPLLELATSVYSSHPMSSLKMRWMFRSVASEIKQRQTDLCEKVLSDICRLYRPDFIGVQVVRKEDLGNARYLVNRLRRRLPSCRAIAFGAYFRRNSGDLSRYMREFDCLYTNVPGPSFASWATALQEQYKWRSIGNLAFTDAVRFQVTAPEDASPQNLPQPDYRENTYIALSQCTKLKVFEVAESYESGANPGTSPRITAQPRLPSAVADEIEQVSKAFGAQAFDIVGGEGAGVHPHHLATEVLTRKIPLRYSRSAHVTHVSNPTLATLKSSGCMALSFQVDSGSQLLLDRHYRNGFTVTDVEQAVRAAKFNNLYTVTRFTYPSPEDDYHTREETLRIIDRTKPHSAFVHLPGQPGSLVPLLEGYKSTLSRKNKRLAKNQDLRAAIEALGVRTNIAASLALIAEFAGYSGNESDFRDQTAYQLLTGDSLGLATLIDNINRNACRSQNTLLLSPFVQFQNVIGN